MMKPSYDSIKKKLNQLIYICFLCSIGTLLGQYWDNIKHCNIGKSVQKFSFAQCWFANVANISWHSKHWPSIGQCIDAT